MKRTLVIVILIGMLTVLLIAWMLQSPFEQDHKHDHQQVHDDGMQISRGPHGGRLLTQDDFALEISLFETGLPPEFRVYAYHHDQPLEADMVDLELVLKRSGDKVDRIQFIPQGDYLRGSSVVYEPHSFEVSVNATYAQNSYSWQYDNFEGRARIPETIAAEMGIKTEAVGPIILTETRTLTGRVQTNPNLLSRVRPRFPGIIKAIRHELGDVVSAGDILVTVQSNESLQDYNVRASIDGLIIRRDIQVGEATSEEPLFIIADLSELWVELDVFVRDLEHIKTGMPVTVETLDGGYQVPARIDWISPLTAHASQSVRARVSVSNKDGRLRPGQFVRGRVTVAEHRIPVAVRQSALQQFRDFRVVFARFGDLYEVRMLELGRQNREWAEVLSGIGPGTQYVTENSYLIKADIEKAGASHEH